jgi:hypothetical protein
MSSSIAPDPAAHSLALATRRTLFQRTGFGLGGLALNSLLADAPPTQLAHHPRRAKNVIYIHLVGAPSHLDLFEPKPELARRSGELCPDEMFKGNNLAFIRSQPTLLGTPDRPEFHFRRCPISGHPISNLLPHLQSVAPHLAFVRAVETHQFNHAPAQLALLTGFERLGRPSIGAWASYGIGSENMDLPSFVVLISGQVLGAGNSAWGPGFLPTIHQGVEFRSQGDPVLFLSNPPGLSPADRASSISTVNALNQVQLADVADPEIATRIAQYEMAYRMQSSVPELMDVNSEPAAIHQLYGTSPGKASFANNCLLARRLVERGVRFVQLFDEGWDHHGGVFDALPNKARQVDQPIAALIKDLHQRGLLEETLVVWSAEFGRTPMAQEDRNKPGRDHHRQAFTVWMAGGGTAPGSSHGSTDELGFAPAEGKTDIHDLNATILHLLGIDHQRLTFRTQGRDFRLTDVHGHVIHPILS